MRERYGMHTFGQSVLMSRRLIEAGTRFVQVNWPSVANGDPEKTAWDTHAANFGTAEEPALPEARQRSLSALLEDMDARGMLKETIVIAIGEFGRSPRMGVCTSGNSNAPMAATTGRTVTAPLSPAPASRAACSTANPMRPPRVRKKSRSIRTICSRLSTLRSASIRTWRYGITSISRESWLRARLFLTCLPDHRDRRGPITRLAIYKP